MTNPESPTARFERIAAEFQAATGMLAPGKDQPGAMGGPAYDQRLDAFVTWTRERTARVERDAQRWSVVLPLLGQVLRSRHFADVSGPEMYLLIGDHELRCGATHGFTDVLVCGAVDNAMDREAPTHGE